MWHRQDLQCDRGCERQMIKDKEAETCMVMAQKYKLNR